MKKEEFKQIRQFLQKTQIQMAQLLGTSLKAVQSFEQGWRNIPVHIERQMFFIITMKESQNKLKKPCWKEKKCTKEMKEKCPVWNFKIKSLCWVVNGTICQGEVQENWEKKMEICRECSVFKSIVPVLDSQENQ